MFKTSLIIGFVCVSMSMAVSPPVNPLEEYAIGNRLGGKTFLCAVNSCENDAVEKATAIVCDYVALVKNLKEVTALAFAGITLATIPHTVGIQPKCIDPLFKCQRVHDEPKVPEVMIDVGNNSVDAAEALNCVKDVTGKDLKKVEEIIVEYQNHISEDAGAKGLECAEVMSKNIKILTGKLQEICDSLKGH